MWTMLLVPLLAGQAVAGCGCPAMRTAGAADLLALPGENPRSFECTSPGVRCATLEGVTAGCPQGRTTITRDETLAGDRRLVVVRAGDAERTWDCVFVFGCVGGRPRAVFHDRFRAGVSIVEATRRAVVVRGSTPFDDPEPRRRVIPLGDVTSPKGARERGRPGDGPEPARCDDVVALPLAALHPTNRDGFRFDHGPGCYSEIPEIDPTNCGWDVTLVSDRSTGGRRAVVLHVDHRGGTGVWDEVFVFGCVDGRVATLFADSFEWGATVEEASPDGVTVRAGAWPDHEERRRYDWHDGLRSYVLRSVESGPRSSP